MFKKKSILLITELINIAVCKSKKMISGYDTMIQPIWVLGEKQWVGMLYECINNEYWNKLLILSNSQRIDTHILSDKIQINTKAKFYYFFQKNIISL